MEIMNKEFISPKLQELISRIGCRKQPELATVSLRTKNLSNQDKVCIQLVCWAIQLTIQQSAEEIFS